MATLSAQPSLQKALEQLPGVVRELDGNGFYAALIEWVCGFLAVDSVSVIAYAQDRPPTLLFEALTERERTLFFARFMDGTYVASPSYRGVIDNAPPGVYLWSALMPDNFRQSALYKSYYQPSQIEDLAYVFCVPAPGVHIQLGLGRHAPNPAFSSGDLASLYALETLILELVNKHYHLSGRHVAPDAVALSRHVNQRVKEVLDNFGEGVLTEREKDIAKLIISGYSSQAAADKLCISPGTERVHRAKVYAKLNLRSNSELFSLFLRHLTALSG
ncbi:helix-turn-helix transcriptional regulator [Alteromonas gilva]|uniref:LuxR C-terminal-related transcriptional regulator n=1 Tax=Alteromonas gilva TaxID=2987522 RepID=A0ABT5L7V9_9ALTE|nr:LuxR C-terminal-related transcriptional regulator [Alteromonas gilva]MDC8831922.1 LuxR C-terminal-related transcriptional regulator [Alteromonas gilva]